MKTAAIINFWDCGELLPYAVKNWFKCVDEVIIIFSDRSNYGETLNNTSFLRFETVGKAHVMRCEPIQLQPVDNERRKRNFGIEYARSIGITHFVITDADEFYEPEEFKRELKRFEDPNLNGLVCGCQTYFKSPMLTIGLDTTRITFIHKLTPQLRFTWNMGYPFAWEAKSIRIDPTRQLNITDGVEWSDIICHHYSWYRKDYEIKIRNSTARPNIERSEVREEIGLAAEGYFLKFYGKHLVTAPNRFDLPIFNGEHLDEILHPGQ